MNDVDIKASVILLRGREVYSWVIPICPNQNCREIHWHGGGYIKTEHGHKADDPRDFLSDRAAHCSDDFSGYTLIEDENYRSESGYSIPESRKIISLIRRNWIKEFLCPKCEKNMHCDISKRPKLHCFKKLFIKNRIK